MTPRPSGHDDKPRKPTYCPTCGLQHDPEYQPKADNRTECHRCARLRYLLAERFTKHERGE